MTTITNLVSQPVNIFWDQKQSIKRFLSNYPTKFDMEPDAMDLRTMAENYSHGIIPLEDIHQGLMAILGPNYDPNLQKPYDPSEGIPFFPSTLTSAIAPQFGYVNWNQLYLYSIFQRDVAANHCAKLKKDWDHTAVLIPCAIKFTLNDKVYYCVWDGHHTLQTARIMNYTKFPVWYIDIDAIPEKTIIAAGFTDDEEGRIQYGCWLAGKNMIRINATNKRPLAHYDKFMILLETKDKKAVAMNQIIQSTGCVVKRSQKVPGSWTQINSGEECYDLLQSNGLPSLGMFWRHALEFHRTVWPMAALELEVFRPMSYLYQAINLGGYTIDAQFDKELEIILAGDPNDPSSTGLYGDAESVQREIKESYENAIRNNLGRGALLKNNKDIIKNGLINLYNQHCGRLIMPPADYVWKV
jgi:hypothetical protein